MAYADLPPPNGERNRLEHENLLFYVSSSFGVALSIGDGAQIYTTCSYSWSMETGSRLQAIDQHQMDD